MKGFGIYVKNDLLEPKHVDKMGAAIWLYLWMLDKMTSVGEDGVGLVLGGKPVKAEEVIDALGISLRTYRRWVITLKEAGYIRIVHAPYGIIFRVMKAKKVFGQKPEKRSAKSGTPLNKRSARNGTPTVPDVALLSDKNGTPNKDKTVRQDSKTLSKESSEVVSYGNEEINKLVNHFEGKIGTFTRKKMNRYAANRLLKKHGLKGVAGAINYAAQVRGQQYAPQVTSFLELEDKWLKLEAHAGKRVKQQQEDNQLKEFIKDAKK